VQGELARVVEMVEAFCGAHNLPKATCNLMNLALDEVLSNIVKYAYASPETETIDVGLSYSDNKLIASIEDRGVPFNPLGLRASTEGGVSLHSRKEGGLGILFMKSLSDSVVYERVADRNKVTLTIKISSDEP
jgi:anti-sigma regulatory factor (Ser/Thr protein kinase)